jgi:hypothetical protein
VEKMQWVAKSKKIRIQIWYCPFPGNIGRTRLNKNQKGYDQSGEKQEQKHELPIN